MSHKPIKVGGRSWKAAIKRIAKAHPGEKIRATKALRKETGCGLQEAVNAMYPEYTK